MSNWLYYTKKPTTIQAAQWWENGDCPDDACETFDRGHGPFQGEGKVVRYYRRPDCDGQDKCKHCGKIMHVHGWIETLEGGHIVCPGDRIIKGVKGEYYPVKPDIFDTLHRVASMEEQTAAAMRDGDFVPLTEVIDTLKNEVQDE
jgi:hypothetical protein